MNVQVKNVSFSYPSGVVALQDISLTIMSGEAVAIIGENGAGKTTLAKHLNGLLKPTEGWVFVDDWDTRDQTIAQMASRVGYVFQNPDDQLFERTVWAEVAFGPRNLGQSEEAVRAGVEAALAQVGLEAEADRHPYDLHASHRKLVALAATLAMRTPIVILDEPTTGQDAVGVARLGEIVEGLKAEARTVLTISHDIDFCAEHFERIIVMSQGQILADGSAKEVLSQGHLLAQAYVDPPQLVRLAAALGLPNSPLTVKEFIAALTTAKSF